MTYIEELVKDLKKTVLEREISYNHTIFQTAGKFHSPLASLQINPENILTYLDMAIPQKKLLIDDYSFYVFDLSKNKKTEYNTLVFQKEGVPLKTVEKTSQVMSRFFSHSKVSYESIQFLGKILDIHQKCPYVLGNKSFAPDRGTSKKDANWIAFHHVENVSSIDNRSLLSIHPHHELVIEMNTKRVYQMLDRISLIAEAERRLVKESTELFERRFSSLPTNNVVERHLRSGNVPEIPSVLSLHNQLIYVKAIQVLSEVFEEEDPYYDDIRKAFPILKEIEMEM